MTADTPQTTNYMEQSLYGVSIGHTDGTHWEDRDGKPSITLWALMEFGDLPQFLTPQEAIEVGEALIRRAKQMEGN